jgi:FkbM family methyltransferase
VSFKEIKFNSESSAKKSNLVERKIHNFNFLLDLESDGISKPLYYQGFRERVFMSLLYQEISEGDVCVDLGSNIGFTTLFMSEKAGQTGKVYAIEPDPWNVNMLRQNITNNGFDYNTTVYENAITDKEAEIEFWQSEKSNLSSVQKTKHSTRSIKVKAHSLKTFLKDKDYPNFIKMDIEGHEVKVFEGALEYFKNNKKGTTKILLEVHPQFYNKDNDFDSILKEYFKIGFKVKYVVTTPVARPRKFIDAGYKPIAEVPTDGFVRGLYGEISEDHLLDFACKENIEGSSKKIVRSFMLER